MAAIEGHSDLVLATWLQNKKSIEIPSIKAFTKLSSKPSIENSTTSIAGTTSTFMVDFSISWSFVCQNILGLGNTDTSNTTRIPCNTPTYTYNSYKFLVTEMHTATACEFDCERCFDWIHFWHRSQFHYVYFYPCQLFRFTQFGHFLWIFCKM